MSRTYADAVAALNTLQSNFAIVDAIRKSGKKMNEQAIPEMIEWCNKIGYQTTDLNTLNAIHIAGTKGKGSTAAFISSMLNEFRRSAGLPRKPYKIGLYTSPHLRFVRERIQIDGAPLSEDQFAKYFFETWDRLEKSATDAGQDPKAAASKPVYFRFLTLMAFHTFKAERVDTAIIECGIGGAYDSTNIIPAPAITAITSLGIDHVGVLGSTLPEIAWHKAGIMKPSAPCFTPSSQDPSAKAVLEDVARKVPTELTFTDIPTALAENKIKLGLQGDFQKDNAALAIKVVLAYLKQRHMIDQPDIRLDSDDNNTSENLIKTGLTTTRWAGRCDTRHQGNITWCIDGGHTLESIKLAGQWFASQLQEITRPNTRIKTYLIFNQQTRERDASTLAKALHGTLAPLLAAEQGGGGGGKAAFDVALFTPNTTFSSATSATKRTAPDLISVGTNTADVDSLVVQKELAETWKGLDKQARVEVRGSIEEVVGVVRGDGGGDGDGDNVRKVVLVTGSLHLVGGVLEVLEGGAGGGGT